MRGLRTDQPEVGCAGALNLYFLGYTYCNFNLQSIIRDPIDCAICVCNPDGSSKVTLGKRGSRGNGEFKVLDRRDPEGSAVAPLRIHLSVYLGREHSAGT